MKAMAREEHIGTPEEWARAGSVVSTGGAARGFLLTVTKGFAYDRNHCGVPAMAGKRSGNGMSETAARLGWAG